MQGTGNTNCAALLYTGTLQAGLRYDPLGRLYEVSGASGITRMLYDGDALTAEYDPSGNLLRRYVHGADAAADDPVAWYDGPAFTAANERQMRPDWQGSIVLVTDSSGISVIAVNRYDEYGIPQSTNAGRFQYTGQAWLAELGMYYYKARIYSPTLGRFLQTDPIGYEDQANLYAYVGNDPVNMTDPDGKEGVLNGIADWGKMVANDLVELGEGLAKGKIEWALGGMPPTLSGGANIVAAPIRAVNAMRILPGCYCDGRFNLLVEGRKVAGTACLIRRSANFIVQLSHAIIWVEGDIAEDIAAIARFEGELGLVPRYDLEVHATLEASIAARILCTFEMSVTGTCSDEQSRPRAQNY